MAYLFCGCGPCDVQTIDRRLIFFNKRLIFCTAHFSPTMSKRSHIDDGSDSEDEFRESIRRRFGDPTEHSHVSSSVDAPSPSTDNVRELVQRFISVRGKTPPLTTVQWQPEAIGAVQTKPPQCGNIPSSTTVEAFGVVQTNGPQCGNIPSVASKPVGETNASDTDDLFSDDPPPPAPGKAAQAKDDDWSNSVAEDCNESSSEEDSKDGLDKTSDEPTNSLSRICSFVDDLLPKISKRDQRKSENFGFTDEQKAHMFHTIRALPAGHDQLRLYAEYEEKVVETCREYLAVTDVPERAQFAHSRLEAAVSSYRLYTECLLSLHHSRSLKNTLGQQVLTLLKRHMCCFGHIKLVIEYVRETSALTVEHNELKAARKMLVQKLFKTKDQEADDIRKQLTALEDRLSFVIAETDRRSNDSIKRADLLVLGSPNAQIKLTKIFLHAFVYFVWPKEESQAFQEAFELCNQDEIWEIIQNLYGTWEMLESRVQTMFRGIATTRDLEPALVEKIRSALEDWSRVWKAYYALVHCILLSTSGKMSIELRDHIHRVFPKCRSVVIESFASVIKKLTEDGSPDDD